ncbi:DUF6941 family protein [Pseudonocardia sp. Cha107L01]|uniref:DUF6941 family protein n=1 Tax=Pseudonocardia sp. Cha107L01 TaxID=3457576 RepID=UPI00403ECB31
MDVDVLLADYAQVHAGKLFVSGAGINLLTPSVPGPPYVVHFALALTVTIPWQATNQRHTLRVSLVDTDGEQVQLTEPAADTPPEERGKITAQFNAGRSPIMQPGEESVLPIALPFLGLALPHPGSYRLLIELNDMEPEGKTFRVLDPEAPHGFARR